MSASQGSRKERHSYRFRYGKIQGTMNDTRSAQPTGFRSAEEKNRGRDINELKDEKIRKAKSLIGIARTAG